MEMERELYTYQVLKAGTCKPSVPDSASLYVLCGNV